MKRLTRALSIIVLVLSYTTVAFAEGAMTDTFYGKPEERWRFFADTVMGGVSSGQVSFAEENGSAYASLTGQVSTENRGGFIQIRKELSAKPTDGATGVRLVVRGNGEKYFVHLRTKGTILPWQYYQDGFYTTNQWSEVRIPFTGFKASGKALRSKLRPSSLKSIGIVAFGREHQADVEIQEVGFY